MTALFSCENLSVSFGAVRAVQPVSFSLLPGENAGLAGANGAGKTTLFNLITGFCPPDTGRMFFQGRPLRGSPSAFARRGLARTFQNLRLFPGITVRDQIRAAYCACGRKGPEPETLLRKTPLGPWAEKTPEDLPYGMKKLCELLRCAATGAALICLDEPAAGMNADEKKALARLLVRLQDQFPLQYFIIEHDLSFLRSVCPRLLVMEKGVLIDDGPAGAVLKDPSVRASFLGSRPALREK